MNSGFMICTMARASLLKTPYIFVSLLVLPFSLRAQTFREPAPHKDAIPEPFERVYFTDHNRYDKVASIATVSRSREKGFTPDTLNIRYFDTGLLIKEVRYEKNVPVYTSCFSYYSNRNLALWQLTDKGRFTHTLFQYDSLARIKEIAQFRITKANGISDTLRTSHTSFTYSAEGLKEIGRAFYHDMRIETFAYTAGKLVRKTEGRNHTEFTYDGYGNLIGTAEYSGTGNDPVLLARGKFSFNGLNQLVADSMQGAGHLRQGKYSVTVYDYDSAGNLRMMETRLDSFYRKAVFHYTDQRINSVNLITNRQNSAYLRFWISHRIEDYYSFPIDYREVYTYDHHDNRIAKLIYVNDELFSEIRYDIRYVE